MKMLKQLTKAQAQALAAKVKACEAFANKLNALVTLKNGVANNVSWGMNADGDPVLSVAYPGDDLGFLEGEVSKEVLHALSAAKVTVVINLAAPATPVPAIAA